MLWQCGNATTSISDIQVHRRMGEEMTREEAIEKLRARKNESRKILRGMGHNQFTTIDYECEELNMAIEALEQPEIIYCKDCKYHKPGVCDLLWTPVDDDNFCWNGKKNEQ